MTIADFDPDSQFNSPSGESWLIIHYVMYTALCENMMSSRKPEVPYVTYCIVVTGAMVTSSMYRKFCEFWTCGV